MGNARKISCTEGLEDRGDLEMVTGGCLTPESARRSLKSFVVAHSATPSCGPRPRRR